MTKKISTIAIFLVILFVTKAQDVVVIDKIIARIGDEIILKSTLEEEYLQSSIYFANENITKCQVLENIMIQKLLVNQSKIDSIFVTDDELNAALDERLNFIVNQLGSVATLEAYYNKPYIDIKEDLKKTLKESFISEKEKQHILKDISITPSEVADYYKNLPEDKIPLIEESYQIRVIYIYPQMTKEEEQALIDQLNELRDKIVSGQRRFDAMARAYSKDELSAKNGGELGYLTKAELDPDFAAVAFSLKKDQISNVVKTRFGYHIIQLIDKKGQRVNVRHILLQPIVSTQTQQKALNYADSIRNLIVSNNITFEQAAKLYSEDTKTKNNGGLMFNEKNETINFTFNELPAQIRYEIQNLNQGDISEPIISTDQYRIPVIKIYRIDKKIPAHKANIKDDYPTIHKLALADKKEKEFKKWVQKTIKKTYIYIDKDYQNCDFKYIWK